MFADSGGKPARAGNGSGSGRCSRPRTSPVDLAHQTILALAPEASIELGLSRFTIVTMFTPVNSSDAQRSSQDGPRAAAEEESVAPDYHAATTAASAYLGLVDPAKKLITKSKKRGSNARDPSKTKRRQTSKVDDDLRVHKAGVEDELDAINHEIISPATFESSLSKSKKSMASKLPSTATSVSNSVDELASTAAKPIAVFISKTTMDALDTTSMQTSIQHAKASDGQGFTIYQGSSSTASYLTSAATTKSVIANEQQTLTGSIPSRVSGGPSNRHSARLERVPDAQNELSQIRRSSGPFENDYVVADDIGDVLSEIDMIDLVEMNESESEFRTNTPPRRGCKMNSRDVDELEDYGGALLSDADKRALGTPSSCSALPSVTCVC